MFVALRGTSSRALRKLRWSVYPLARSSAAFPLEARALQVVTATFPILQPPSNLWWKVGSLPTLSVIFIGERLRPRSYGRTGTTSHDGTLTCSHIKCAAMTAKHQKFAW